MQIGCCYAPDCEQFAKFGIIDVQEKDNCAATIRLAENFFVDAWLAQTAGSAIAADGRRRIIWLYIPEQLRRIACRVDPVASAFWQLKAWETGQQHQSGADHDQNCYPQISKSFILTRAFVLGE